MKNSAETTGNASSYIINTIDKKNLNFRQCLAEADNAEEALSKTRNFSQTARKYNLTFSQVQRWVKQYPVLKSLDFYR